MQGLRIPLPELQIDGASSPSLGERILAWSLPVQTKWTRRNSRARRARLVQSSKRPIPPKARNELKGGADVKGGQRPAIVAGTIFVLLGVGYLVLIQLLYLGDVILVPPPPEAFNP